MKLILSLLLLTCVVYFVSAQLADAGYRPGTGGRRCRDDDDGRYGTKCCSRDNSGRCCRDDDDRNRCCRSYDNSKRCCGDNDRDDGRGPRRCKAYRP